MKQHLHILASRLRRLPRCVRWGGGSVISLAVLLIIASSFVDEPLRTYMEGEMNRNLKGYTVRLPELRTHFIGLSVTLKDLTVAQQADPGHPIARFPRLKASIHWRALLSRRLVAEFEVDRPKVSINLNQLRRETANAVPMNRRGWQEAVLAIYPLKLNLLTIREGELTYVDEDARRPLHLSRLNFSAANIQNIKAPDQVYPSSFHLDTVIFGSGHGKLDGVANFFVEPHAGVKARYELDTIPVDLIKPIVARSNIALRGGILRSAGEVEYSPVARNVHVADVTIRDMTVDYLHSTGVAGAAKRRAPDAKQAAKRAGSPETALRIDQVRLTGCSIGVVNRTASHPYHLFVKDADMVVSNLSNNFSAGPAETRLRGRFMGTGITTANARFRPEKQGPQLDLQLKIEGTQMVAMNDLLRAYGDFDVSAGLFSFYSEVHIRNNRISGYIKPFLKDMQVYDRRMDRGKSFSHQLYEMMVAGVATLLENRSRGEVATRADLSGRLDDPQTSVWQIVGQLFRNAFIKALTPGFMG